MQPEGLVGGIKCDNSHHPFGHVKANPFFEVIKENFYKNFFL